MKNTIIASIAAVLASLIFIVGLAIVLPKNQAGKYQLVSGEYTIKDKTAGTEIEIDATGIFKIDTTTGKTWKFAAEITDKYVETAKEIATAEEGTEETGPELYESWETIY